MMEFEKLYDPMEEEPLKDLNIQITAQSKDIKGNIRHVVEIQLGITREFKN